MCVREEPLRRSFPVPKASSIIAQRPPRQDELVSSPTVTVIQPRVVSEHPGDPALGKFLVALGNAQKHALNLRRRLDAAQLPYIVCLVSNQLEDGDNEAPGMRTCDHQPLDQHAHDLLLQLFAAHGEQVQHRR